MAFSRKALAALALAAASAKVEAAFGSAFSTGPTATDTYIVESWATLTLPAVPSDNEGDLSLWVGMGTSNGDLIQSIAENYDSSDWSLTFFCSHIATSQFADQAAGSSGDAGTAVTFHYKYDDSTGNYTQNVIVGGSVISTLSTSDGYAEGWGSAVECAETNCGTVPAHTWSNVSIILNAADADYIDTLALGEGVEATMTTADNGITWEVGTIQIPGYDFTNSAVITSSSTSSAAAVATSASAAAATPTASGSPYSSSPSGSDSATGAQASGSPSTTGGEGSGSSTWGSSGSQASGGSSWGGFGGSGSSSWGSWGAQHSQGASTSYGSGSKDHAAHGWQRSRIARN